MSLTLCKSNKIITLPYNSYFLFKVFASCCTLICHQHVVQHLGSQPTLDTGTRIPIP